MFTHKVYYLFWLNRVPSPQNEIIEDLLKLIAKKEGILLPDKLAVDIANSSERNVRRAIL